MMYSNSTKARIYPSTSLDNKSASNGKITTQQSLKRGDALSYLAVNTVVKSQEDY